MNIRLNMWLTLVQSCKVTPGYVHLSSFLAQHLFKVNIVSRIHDHVWDETTFALRKALKKYVKDGQRILDLGTGHLGCLSVYCSKIRKVDVLGIDINEGYVKNARKVAAASGRPMIKFERSDWFSNVDGKFDIIFGNIPYVPTNNGMQRKDPHNDVEVWDGGDDGCKHVRKVLGEGGKHLSDQGRLLLGVNTLYVPKSVDLSCLAKESGLKLEHIVKSPWTPSEVYVFSLVPYY